MEANLLGKEEGGLSFAKAITGKTENTVRTYVSQGKIRTKNKPGVKLWFSKRMLLEDMELGFPDQEAREVLKLEGKAI